MKTATPLYIYEDEEGCIFALRVARVATMTALGITDEHYYERLLARQNDWLTCLINAGDENVTYDLRYISQPHPEIYTRGQLKVVLMCRLKGVTGEQAREFAFDLHRLCAASFEDEYEFELVSEPTELAVLRCPFPIKALTEITRRAEMMTLDTLRRVAPKSSPGFKAANEEYTIDTDASKERNIYHLYSYLLNNAPPILLLRLLLMQSMPLMLSFRLRPTALTQDEQLFLESQIARCERYAQLSLGQAGENIESLFPTLQQQARTLQRHFHRTLYALKDNAALLRVEVASAAVRVPQGVVDALGGQLTLPAGGRGSMENLELYLSGGYDGRPCHSESVEARARGLSNLSLTLGPDPKAPTNASRLLYLFDTLEATHAFRLPAPTLEEMPGLRLKTSRTQPAPANLPETGHCVGESRHNGRIQQIFLARGDRRRHAYVVGQTGTGKTTMFEGMILDDIRGGEGVCVIDPHGDLVEKLLTKIPERRADDVVLIDPADVERPIGLNILEYDSEAQKYFLVQEFLAVIETLMERYDSNMMGPMFFQQVRMVLLLIMSNPEKIGTLMQFYQVFNSKNFYRRFLPLPASVTDPMLRKFVEEVLPATDYTRQTSEGGSLGGWVSSKFAGFVSDPMLRNIFGQTRSSINMREIMDTGKILLVNLSKGRLGEVNSRLLGMLLITKLQASAMGRANIPLKERRDFYLYVDEFQNLATLNFGTLLSEARKYRLSLILTNQYVTQVDPRISSAISGNVGTTISFRVGAPDAELLEREYTPVFNRYDLMQLPNFNACVSTLIDGQVSRPFTMCNRMDNLQENTKRDVDIRNGSRRRYGKRRSEVEQEIADSLQYETAVV
jgi:hypothetical protein